MSTALTPGVAVGERSASHSHGEKVTRHRRSRSKPPRELPPTERRQQSSSHPSSSVHDASADTPVTRLSPCRASSAAPMRTRSSALLARAHSSSVARCVDFGDGAQVDGIATAAAATASRVCRLSPSSQFSPAVHARMNRIRHLLLEVKLPFIDVYLAEKCLFHLARCTPTTEAVDGALAVDVPASTDRPCREPGICRDVTSMPPSALQGAELGRATTTRSATSSAASPVLRLSPLEASKQARQRPFQMTAHGSKGHRDGRAASAAFARSTRGWKAKQATKDGCTATAHANRRAQARDPGPPSPDARDDMDKADLANCSQAAERRFLSPPLPPRPPRSAERSRPPARAGIIRRSTPAESCGQHWHGVPAASPLSLLEMLERVLAKYRAALAVALRAVMHREAVWTALQQFLHVVRSDWAPLAVQDAETVALVLSQGRSGLNGASDMRLSASGFSEALFRVRSPGGGAGSSSDVTVSACQAEAHLSLYYTPRAVSSSPSAGEGEYGAVERCSTPETPATLQTPSEPTRHAVDREATRSSSAASLKTAAEPARNVARHGHSAKLTAHSKKEWRTGVALLPPETAGGADGDDHSRRQKRSPLRLSADSLRRAPPLSAGAAAEFEGASPCNSQPAPRRAAPLLRVPTTPPSSAGATKDATGARAPARARSAIPLNRRTPEHGDPSSASSAGAGRPARNAAGYPTPALRHVSATLPRLPQTRQPQRFATSPYGACHRSRSAPSVSAAPSHSPRPPRGPSLAATPRARIMSTHGIEARGAPLRTAQSGSDPETLMTPMREQTYRSLCASSASPAPQQQELNGASSVDRRSESEGATRPHSGLVPSLGVRLHAVSRQVYLSCLYHYLFYLQRTTLAVVEAVGALRRHHLSYAAPFVVEHRNYLLEVLMQTSVLASDAAVQWLMHEGTVAVETNLKAEVPPCPAAAQHSELNRNAMCRPTSLPSASRRILDHTSDARRAAHGKMVTSSSRRHGAALMQDAEQAEERASQRAAARGRWPEQLLRAPLMSTHASLARYAATPRLLCQLEAATSTSSGAREEAAAGTTPIGGGDGFQPLVPASISPAPGTLPTLRLVLPPDVLLSYGGGAATPEDEVYHARIASASAIGSDAVPPAAALRRRLESGERFLHGEVAAQLEYLKTCMQCALQQEYLPHLRGMAEVHRRLFSDKGEGVRRRDDAAKRACSTDCDRTDATVMSTGSPAKPGGAAATTTCGQSDRVLLEDELFRADWMKELQVSWQLLMSGSSSVE
ncbi:hypothetical protein CUR178_08317 [Leishmania enriettii]|uniref:Uncharacterized protein n=1 Tax=Leishmania enriettii TaxID=5663 RepID=A0A836KUU8_LEIEN|nr:hypothetical protein CUR178_08317 [Leishmania enriettii]